MNPTQRAAVALELRATAAKRASEVENLMQDRKATSHKMRTEAENRMGQAQKLEWVAAGCEVIADIHEWGMMPRFLSEVKDEGDIRALLDKRGFVGLESSGKSRVKRLGVEDEHDYNFAKLALQKQIYNHMGGKLSRYNSDFIKANYTALTLVGTVPGFVPTPYEIGRDMVRRLDIREGHEILEPSCGSGNLLDMIKESHPISKITAIEKDYKLVDICHRKGHTYVKEADFHKPGWRHPDQMFDRIIMNPAFENGQDAIQISNAYTMLASQGILVAICGGSFQFSDREPYVGFRNFLSNTDAEVIKLPDGSFEESGTPIGTYMLVIERNEPHV